jgi:hypothetical protein
LAYDLGRSVSREGARIVRPSAGAHLATLPGFSSTVFATGLENPREIKVAPDGNVFVAESAPDRIRVLRTDGAEKAEKSEIFASRLDSPFGIAFYPPGPTHNSSMSRILPLSAFRTRTAR